MDTKEQVIEAIKRRALSEFRQMAVVRDMSDGMATKMHQAKANALAALYFEVTGQDISEVRD